MAIRLVQLIEAAGFPPGVVNLITGLGGAETGTAGASDSTAWTRSPSPARPRSGG